MARGDPVLEDISHDKVRGLVLTDLAANRPLAGIAGRWFISSDTLEISYDDGVVWHRVGVLRGKDIAEIMTNPQKADHKSALYTLAAGAEIEIISLTGNSLANIISEGDGDGIFNMRIYANGILEDEFPTNWRGIAACAPVTSLSVRLHNPTAAVTTQTSTSLRIRAIMR